MVEILADRVTILVAIEIDWIVDGADIDASVEDSRRR